MADHTDRTDSDRLRVRAAAAVVAGAVLVAGSGLAVWLEVLGSELTGYRLAELIGDFGDELSGVPPSWVGAAWYLFPASAAVCWLLVFRRAPMAPALAHAFIGGAIAVAAVFYLALADVQPGPMMALVGGLLVAVGGLWARRTDPHHH